MNEDGTPIEAGAAGAAGAPEGTAVAEPTSDDVASMYKELNIKAPVPTGKAVGRPKSSTVRAKDGTDDKDADTKPGRKEDKSGDSKSKDAPTDDNDGAPGDAADAASKEVGKTDGKVSGKSKEADDGVRGDKSRAEEDTERGSEDGADGGADGAGQKAHDEGGEEEEGQDAEEGKRPGKSNPEVERRIQKLTAEKREAIERAETLEKKLLEKEQLVKQAKIAAEDPEYTVGDFRKVQDKEGNIIDLDEDQAELAWRRWKDGYEERAEQRQAKANHEAAEAEKAEEASRQVMAESVKAYDTLSALMDEYPELVETSGKFNGSFAAKAMPVIKAAMQYLEGTEPGNAEGNKPIITGLKIDPRVLLDAMKEIDTEKRSLPLNGTNDNVEARSNVAVPHSRSSDPTVQAANDLMKTLNINKRF